MEFSFTVDIQDFLKRVHEVAIIDLSMSAHFCPFDTFAMWIVSPWSRANCKYVSNLDQPRLSYSCTNTFSNYDCFATMPDINTGEGLKQSARFSFGLSSSNPKFVLLRCFANFFFLLLPLFFLCLQFPCVVIVSGHFLGSLPILLASDTR